MQRYTYHFHAMACDNTIQLNAPDALLAKHAAALAIAEVERIEKKYSRYLTDSVVSIVNNQAGRGVPSKIDSETALLLDFANTCYVESDGLFDITSGVLRRVWNFKAAKPPHQAEIASVLPLIGWPRVIRTQDTIYLPVVGMELDVGGFGKEYAADRAAAILLAANISSGFVDLGGDIVVLGADDDGTPFSLGVRHPRLANQLLVTLDIAQGAVASSGDYERFIAYEGKRYSHILNPNTGMSVMG
ncbi:MAG: FAD:protein FMN transferase, partial [Gammaproteobacteria bacterium]|nr:FAD:protein FMN transferase [Gammaproteobacteria bacterium]